MLRKFGLFLLWIVVEWILLFCYYVIFGSVKEVKKWFGLIMVLLIEI